MRRERPARYSRALIQVGTTFLALFGIERNPRLMHTKCAFTDVRNGRSTAGTRNPIRYPVCENNYQQERNSEPLRNIERTQPCQKSDRHDSYEGDPVLSEWCHQPHVPAIPQTMYRNARAVLSDVKEVVTITTGSAYFISEYKRGFLTFKNVIWSDRGSPSLL